jgi:carbonic anhydrase
MQKELREGHAKFLDDYFSEHEELFKNLSTNQTPNVMIVTCSDSRVDPTLITNSKPGDIFIVRNIGNVIPPYSMKEGSTIAAIEYAVYALDIKKIIILGHSNCGACAHMYHEYDEEGEVKLPHVEQWLQYIKPAKHAAMLEVHADKNRDIFEITEKANVVSSLNRLMGYPGIQERILDGRINLAGWWYNIGTGDVQVYDFTNKEFNSLKD